MRSVSPFVFSLVCMAVACGDDEPRSERDGSRPFDSGWYRDAGWGDAGMDASISPDDDAGDGSMSDEPGPDAEFSLDFSEIAIPSELAVRLLGHRFLPGSDELFLWNQQGLVGHFEFRGDRLQLLGSFELNPALTEADCGIQLAFDPDFEDNGHMYFTQCESFESSGVYRYVFDPGDYESIADSAVPIISAGRSDSTLALHNVGALGFDEQGQMWVLFGDKRKPQNAQDTSNNLGSLVRVRVDDDPGGGYLPVDDNPFATDPDSSGDIYAFGLRSPYFGLRDRHGFYWVADIGSDDAEEVNLITEAGQNFGFVKAEGYCDPDETDCSGYTDPLFTWPHSFDHQFYRDDPETNTRSARAVFVGVEYRPMGAGKDPYRGELDHHVLFGDLCTGFLRAALIDEDGELVEDRHVGHIEGALSWQQAPDGSLTVVSYGDCINEGDASTGALYRVHGVWTEED